MKKSKRTLTSVSKERFEKAIDVYFLWKELDKELRLLSGKRGINLPSEITEVLVAYVFGYKICEEGSGDIVDDSSGEEKVVEVKGASSTGPNSFSPSEHYDKLIFINLENREDDIFKIYDTGLNSDDIGKVKVNKTETVADQQKQGRRPRFKIPEFLNEKKITYSYEINMKEKTITPNSDLK